MTEIYLIRHTQAEGNIYKMMQGFWDGDVTELGLREIDALAERFRYVHVDAVYSSDLYRAWLTAAAVTRYNGLEVITDKRIREINVGPLEGTFFGNTIHDNPESMERFLMTPWEWSMDGAETMEDVSERAVPAFREFAERHDGQSIAVVSHGITVRCILTKCLDLPKTGEGSVPIVGNTSVSKLIYDNGIFSAEYLNDVSHLEGLPLSDWIQKDALRHEYINPSDDRDFYLSCYRDAWAFAHEGSLKHFNPDVYLESAGKHYADSKEAVIKLYLHDEPAGLLELNTEKGKHLGYGWISLLYLLPEFRRKGYGIQVLGRAIMYYHSLGMKSIRLNVAASNRQAVRFYERYGFGTIASEPGADGPLYLMERTLGRIADSR